MHWPVLFSFVRKSHGATMAIPGEDVNCFRTDLDFRASSSVWLAASDVVAERRNAGSRGFQPTVSPPIRAFRRVGSVEHRVTNGHMSDPFPTSWESPSPRSP